MHEVRERLASLREAVLNLGRLHWVELLATSELAEKANLASLRLQCIYVAGQIDDFLWQTAQVRPAAVGWAPRFCPNNSTALADGRINTAAIRSLKQEALGLSRNAAQRLLTISGLDSLTTEAKPHRCGRKPADTRQP
jgi:hypothetical protein